MQLPPEYYELMETAVETAIKSGMSFNDLMNGFKLVHARKTRKVYPDCSLSELADKTGFSIDYLADHLDEVMSEEIDTTKTIGPDNLYDINTKKLAPDLKKRTNHKSPDK